MKDFENLIKELYAMGGCGVITVTIDEQTETPVINVAQAHGDKGRRFYVNEGYVTPCDVTQTWGDAIYYSSMPDGDKARLLHMGINDNALISRLLSGSA